MSLLVEASIILLTALKTGESCDLVFKKMVEMSFPARIEQGEGYYMDRLAAAACETSNPDEIWKISGVESHFRFRIVRINKTQQVLRGNDAIVYLEDIKKSGRLENIDIGAMQINWYWHNGSFDQDPIKMMDPQAQVEYLITSFKPTLKKQCKEAWFGCYHNPANGERARIYSREIGNFANLLKKNSDEFIDSSYQPLSSFRALSFNYDIQIKSHTTPGFSVKAAVDEVAMWRRRLA